MTGIWLWVHYPLSPTDATLLIARLRACGAAGVLLKRSEGNSATDNTGYNYEAAFNALAPQIVSAGFQVAGWSYVYPGDKLGAIVADAATHGAAFFVLDIETEFDGPNGNADAQAVLADIQAAAPNVHLGYAPFPYADDHPQYPYAVLDAGCKVCMPQVYWRDLGAASVDEAYNHTFFSLEALNLKCPVQPIGQTDNGATAAEVQRFAALCKNGGIAGISIWVLDDQSADLDAALAATPYATAPKA